MHVHGISSSQVAGLIPTQVARQALAARRSAAEVRRKLSNVAVAGSPYAVARVDGYTPGDRGGRQNPPQDEDTFRNILTSIKI
jgi:hypothetical protein